METLAVLTDRRKKLKSYRKPLIRRLAGRAGRAISADDNRRYAWLMASIDFSATPGASRSSS